MTANATFKTRPRMETIMDIGSDRPPHILILVPGWQRLSPEEIWQ
jgi:hypothetical protein